MKTDWNGMATAAKYFGAFTASALAMFTFAALVLGGGATNAIASDDATANGQLAAVAQEEAFATEQIAADSLDDSNAEEEPSYEVNLVAVGDNMIHKDVFNAAKQKDGSYDFSSLYANIADDIKNADLASINQESVFVSKNYTGYPRFGSPKAVGHAIADAGFDIVQHANNHVMDKGTSAIKNTWNFWNDNYPKMKVIGIHGSKSCANTIHIVKKNGIKIALLSYTYGTNHHAIPSSKSYLVDMLQDKNKIAKDIKRAKKNADFVIVYAHFGTEYTYKASKDSYAWAKWFSNKGVDLLIGTHPHVVQPVKYVYSNNKKHKMLCYYSLGNFVSKSTRLPNVNSLLGGMAKVKIVKTSPTGKAKIKSYKFVPLVTQKGKAGSYGFTVYKLANYTKKLAKENGFHKEYGKKVSVSYFTKQWKKVTGRSIQS